MASRAALAARIRALERAGSSTSGLTVIIRHFGPAGEAPAQRIADGDAVVDRKPDEDADVFRARAVNVLRRGRRGVVVLAQNAGD